MCGIAGIIQVGGTPLRVCSPETLARMTDRMVHRGPDDRGLFQRNGVAIGARRLSIIDVDGGHQPFANEDHAVWAAQNGELYNHKEIRQTLEARGHTFKSRCDTEILPHLYEEHGDRFAEHLQGMFAVVVWDDTAKKAVLARDRLGIKPLYYAHVGDRLVFGSELKSVLASGLVSSELNYEGIDAYMDLGFFPTPLTPLKQVRKLRPGHRLIVDAKGVREERYWSYPEPTQLRAKTSVVSYAEELLFRLERSVCQRLMSDVPLGAMLSGGLDSSLVVALMARNMSKPVKTFSIGFEGTGRQNELDDAEFVSNYFGTDHHAIELPLDMEVDLASLVWHMDEPLADLSSVGFLALSGLARKHVTVTLSGQGADELFGGYRKHRAAALAGICRKRVGGMIIDGLTKPFLRAPGQYGRMARTLSAADPVTRLLATSGNLGSTERKNLFRGPLRDVGGGQARRAAQALLGGVELDPLCGALHLDAQMGLVDDMLHYFDRASMAHSLEVRVPFLDHEFVEFSSQVPSEYKVGPRFETKHVLKHAARGVVPDRIIDKTKVGFFNQAVDGWITAQLDGPIRHHLLDSSACTADILDRKAVDQLVRQHKAGRKDGAYVLLEILMLETWLRTYLPRALDGS